MNASTTPADGRGGPGTVPAVSVGQGGGSPAAPGGPEPASDPYAYPPVYRPAYPALPDHLAYRGSPTTTNPGYGAYPTYPGYPGYPGYPSYPAAPPKRGRGLLVGLVASLVVLVLLAAIVGVNRSHRTNSAADNAALAVSRAKILAELPRLQAWIASDRGLAWKKSVNPEVLSDADFVAALDSGGGSDPTQLPGDPDDIGTTFAAMGLVPDADSFYNADRSATTSDVVGFYNNDSGRLVVRGTTWTPSMEYTLVHELTHALQDQNFDLGRLDASARTDDETILTTRALVEGDAERVADDYYDEQSTAWQDQVDADQGSAPASSAPIVDVFEGIPYAFGEQFVDGLVKAGGNAAVDKAFRTPPATSAQILHPAQWLDGSLPAPTRPPTPKAPPGDVADIGVLGQLGLWAAVDAAHPHRVDTAKLDGWAGDSYVSTDGGSGTCFVDDATFTSAATRTTAVQFLESWTDAQHIKVQLQGTAGLRLSACQS